MLKKLLRNLCVYVLALNFLTFGMAQTASAALIGTQSALASQERTARIAHIQSALDREMEMLGVNPADAQARVAALTDSEIAQLDQRVSQLPAGAGIIEIIGIVFVVLIILEFLGVTDVFKRI